MPQIVLSTSVGNVLRDSIPLNRTGASSISTQWSIVCRRRASGRPDVTRWRLISRIKHGHAEATCASLVTSGFWAISIVPALTAACHCLFRPAAFSLTSTRRACRTDQSIQRPHRLPTAQAPHWVVIGVVRCRNGVSDIGLRVGLSSGTFVTVNKGDYQCTATHSHAPPDTTDPRSSPYLPENK